MNFKYFIYCLIKWKSQNQNIEDIFHTLHRLMKKSIIEDWGILPHSPPSSSPFLFLFIIILNTIHVSLCIICALFYVIWFHLVRIIDKSYSYIYIS